MNLIKSNPNLNKDYNNATFENPVAHSIDSIPLKRDSKVAAEDFQKCIQQCRSSLNRESPVCDNLAEQLWAKFIEDKPLQVDEFYLNDLIKLQCEFGNFEKALQLYRVHCSSYLDKKTPQGFPIRPSVHTFKFVLSACRRLEKDGCKEAYAVWNDLVRFENIPVRKKRNRGTNRVSIYHVNELLAAMKSSIDNRDNFAALELSARLFGDSLFPKPTGYYAYIYNKFTTERPLIERELVESLLIPQNLPMVPNSTTAGHLLICFLKLGLSTQGIQLHSHLSERIDIINDHFTFNHLLCLYAKACHFSICRSILLRPETFHIPIFPETAVFLIHRCSLTCDWQLCIAVFQRYVQRLAKCQQPIPLIVMNALIDAAIKLSRYHEFTEVYETVEDAIEQVNDSSVQLQSFRIKVVQVYGYA
jgi:hypothetical protein